MLHKHREGILDLYPGIVIRLSKIMQAVLETLEEIRTVGDWPTEHLTHLILLNRREFDPPVQGVEITFCFMYLRNDLSIYELPPALNRWGQTKRPGYALTTSKGGKD